MLTESLSTECVYKNQQHIWGAVFSISVKFLTSEQKQWCFLHPDHFFHSHVTLSFWKLQFKWRHSKLRKAFLCFLIIKYQLMIMGLLLYYEYLLESLQIKVVSSSYYKWMTRCSLMWTQTFLGFMAVWLWKECGGHLECMQDLDHEPYVLPRNRNSHAVDSRTYPQSLLHIGEGIEMQNISFTLYPLLLK